MAGKITPNTRVRSHDTAIPFRKLPLREHFRFDAPMSSETYRKEARRYYSIAGHDVLYRISPDALVVPVPDDDDAHALSPRVPGRPRKQTAKQGA
ncbi:hypothetical protein [Komagataeibacter sp. FNDCR2]|uniref:hypothetical protein n=1 Tax=Komagataeibacter sp. FNDCR2 TaxID=2878682 RepID=UPI001E3C1099|nr:hypothetical protein [Komagataeibacter sp. FNDCR2]MCE2576721.1 hypothetical protein [Komagataeibacter sp. FNDCR2]